MTEAEEAMYNAMRMAFEAERERSEELKQDLREAYNKLAAIREVLDGGYE